jgi:two-component system, cell cycle sensor histidine kinase and response regulator CckA
LGQTFLTRHGFQVLLASDGQEAVEVFEREAGRVDLVILDLTMPRLSGREALRRLRQLDPAVRVVFASGHSADRLGGEEQGQVQGFIAKPYREHDLIDVVQRALEAPRPGQVPTT